LSHGGKFRDRDRDHEVPDEHRSGMIATPREHDLDHTSASRRPFAERE